MLTNEEISERNGLLIELIKELDLGIHIIDLPHKPKLLSADYTRQLSAYVKNFHLILTVGNTDEVYLDIRLKPIRNMEVESIKQMILTWLVIYEHKNIHTLVLEDADLFVTGFNHHNKILKKNPYPVFSRFDPIIYYELEKAESTKERFNEYNLIVK
jgi:metallophosphoesterase superfamily enzyme